jgi:hypothetical protein
MYQIDLLVKIAEVKYFLLVLYLACMYVCMNMYEYVCMCYAVLVVTISEVLNSNKPPMKIEKAAAERMKALSNPPFKTDGAYECMYVSQYVCMYVCINIKNPFMYVCMYVCIHINEYVNPFISLQH